MSDNKSKWPNATIAIVGIITIVGCAVLLKEPDVLWSLVILYAFLD